MDFSALACPQCAGPLPHQALWRMIQCPFCGASVTKNSNLVERAWFRDSLQQAMAAAETAAAGSRTVRVAGKRYQIVQPLGSGSDSDVYLAQRISPLPERVTLKLARAGTPAGTLARKADILQQLQQIAIPGASYFSQRLPQVVAVSTPGSHDAAGNEATQAMVLRHPAGFWGSMADVLHYQPSGIDARHAVWIFRRVLEVLAFIHDAGWCHGDICPEHMLVHAPDHGILLIGWWRAEAQATSAARQAQQRSRDLMQTAWSIRLLLAGSNNQPGQQHAPSLPAGIPHEFATFLRSACEDENWCASLGAAGIIQALGQAARQSFGPAKFIHFSPNPHPNPI